MNRSIEIERGLLEQRPQVELQTICEAEGRNRKSRVRTYEQRSLHNDRNLQQDSSQSHSIRIYPSNSATTHPLPYIRNIRTIRTDLPLVSCNLHPSIRRPSRSYSTPLPSNRRSFKIPFILSSLHTPCVTRQRTKGQTTMALMIELVIPLFIAHQRPTFRDHPGRCSATLYTSTI